MAAITQVRIEGFQSHVESAFHLAGGLNVITGPSDAGKTAIIRAIRWVAFNEPSGEAFVNEKVGEAVVAIHLETGQIITKKRRKGKTSYLVQLDQEDEGSLYEKSEVPDEVIALLKIEKQRFGDFETALNFAFQLDAPFLISETASAGAKILGKLAGTESVDMAIKGIRQDTHSTRIERTNAEKDIERLSGSMLAFLNIDDIKADIELAERTFEQLEKDKQKFESLKEYKMQHEYKVEQVVGLVKKLERFKDLENITHDLQDIEKAQQTLERKQQLYSQYSGVSTQIESLGQTLQHFIGLDSAMIEIEWMDIQAEKVRKLKHLQTEYHIASRAVTEKSSILEKTRNIETAAETIYELENEDLLHLNGLYSALNNYGRVENRLKNTLESVERFEGITEAGTSLESLYEEFERLMLLKTYADSFAHVQTNVLNMAQVSLKRAEEAIKQAKDEESQAWEEAGGICPLCELPHERGVC